MIAVLAAAMLTGVGRSITIAPRPAPSWVLLHLPQGIDSGEDEQYDGLRIIDDTGMEVPYVIDPHCSTAPPRSVAMSDVGYVNGSYTQALLDAGTSGNLYSAISIETPRETFFTRVQVAISDDRRTWREVRSGTLIYRVANSGDPGTQTIDVPPARARWIRGRVFDSKSPFAISGATLTDAQVPVAAPMQRLHATRISGLLEKHANTITLDLGTPHTRISGVHFETPQREFSRDVSLLVSDDGLQYHFAGQGTIERFANGTPSLDVATPATGARFIRAIVANGDDKPLPKLTLSVYGPSRYLVFIAQPGRSYGLVRVQSEAPPQYDLAELLAHDNPRSFQNAELAAFVETVPQQRVSRAQAPSWILTAAFGIASLALGGITLFTLRGGQRS